VSEETDAAYRYRQHAEELRVIASECKDPNTKKTLLSIGGDYEAMANSMDAIDRTNTILKRAR